MDKKYKEFEKFPWEINKDWKTFYKKLSPPPQKSKLLFYKKQFYKEKIDPNFDPNYDPNHPTKNTTKKENSAKSKNNFSIEQTFENYKTALDLCKPIESKLISIIESIIFICFLISLPFQYKSIKISMIGFALRTIHVVGIPKIDVDYLQALIMNDAFHTAIYSLQCLVDGFNYYMMVPIVIAITIALAENITFLTNKKLGVFDYVLQHKEELMQDKAHIELAIGILMFIGLRFKINTFKTPMIYFQLLRIKYMINPYGKTTFAKVNEKVDDIKNGKYCPVVIGSIISCFQVIISALGNMDKEKAKEEEKKD